MRKFWQNMGFGARLSAMIISLVLLAVVSVATMVYIEYKSTSTEAALNRLQGASEGGQQSFMDWLLARQDELQLYSSLSAFIEDDSAQIEDLLYQLAQADGYWDTIYVVDANGVGQHGVSFDGRPQVLSRARANEFEVADRDWFRRRFVAMKCFLSP